MKKKIFGGMTVLAIVTMVAMNVNFSHRNDSLSNISLANIEALANDETAPVFNCTKGSTECVRIYHDPSDYVQVTIFFKS